MRLAGHHALVTGGGTGIGAAIARALAAEGAKLTLVGRRREKLEEVASVPRPFDDACGVALDKLRPGSSRTVGVTGPRPTPGNICVAPADVTDRAQVDAAFALARAAHGPVSILVNNAGAAASAPFAKLTADDWRAALAVNLDALFHCTQAALPDLLAAPAGRIVNIASTAGLKGYGYTAAYVAAKHGAVGLTRALAAEFARTNLTVNAVCPGFTDTDLVDQAVDTIGEKTGRSEEDARAQLAAFNPQGRLIDPAEVASAVVWLCLPENRSVTGQTIVVAGGEVA